MKRLSMTLLLALTFSLSANAFDFRKSQNVDYSGVPHEVIKVVSKQGKELLLEKLVYDLASEVEFYQSSYRLLAEDTGIALGASHEESRYILISYSLDRILDMLDDIHADAELREELERAMDYGDFDCSTDFSTWADYDAIVIEGDSSDQGIEAVTCF